MTLHQIETVKVLITDDNKKANSYTEVITTKPYLASNREYYIQLVLPELVMCKKIGGTFYCEELFLVKHKTQLSCESAIFYNLTREVILENCHFNYHYNISVIPSVLDGGSHILLANMMNQKRLICAYDQGLAKPLPTSSYALVSRDILCNCHLQIGLTYILKSVTSCYSGPHTGIYSKLSIYGLLPIILEQWFPFKYPTYSHNGRNHPAHSYGRLLPRPKFHDLWQGYE